MKEEQCEISKAVASEYHICESDLYKKSKCRHISEPRMVTIALCIATGKLKAKELSFIFDMEPCSVNHATRTVRDLTRLNTEFRLRIVSVLQKISDSQDYREMIIERLISTRKN